MRDWAIGFEREKHSDPEHTGEKAWCVSGKQVMKVRMDEAEWETQRVAEWVMQEAKKIYL